MERLNIVKMTTLPKLTCIFKAIPIETPKRFLMIFNKLIIKISMKGTSLVAQWLRICLPMQGTQVRALLQEDPTCRGATKPMRHNY